MINFILNYKIFKCLIKLIGPIFFTIRFIWFVTLVANCIVIYPIIKNPNLWMSFCKFSLESLTWFKWKEALISIVIKLQIVNSEQYLYIGCYWWHKNWNIHTSRVSDKLKTTNIFHLCGYWNNYKFPKHFSNNHFVSYRNN